MFLQLYKDDIDQDHEIYVGGVYISDGKFLHV